MELLFYNGYGGFDPQKGEYVIDSTTPTPMPWVNCISCVSGEPFGFLISDSGGGFVWKGNSQSGRITPWHCKLVQDPVNERILVVEESGDSHDCIPRIRKQGDRVRFGKGYSVFERDAFGEAGRLSSVLTVYAGENVPVKCSSLTLCAKEDTSVKLLYTVHLCGFVPGMLPCKELPFGVVVDELLFVRCSLPVTRVSWEEEDVRIEVVVRLKANTPAKVDFFLGDDCEDVPLEPVRSAWEEILSTIRVQTPEPAFDLLMNGWLLYQVKSCRLDGRSGYYQSGGAYGFRDQLQDVLAFVYAMPKRVRNQILLHASRQYEEGDVQHWWHPDSGAGVRTRCSDDLLWLVYCTAEYIQVTGDVSILDEPVSFIRSEPLSDTEQDRYEIPEQGSTQSLWEHLRRAIHKGIRLGEHGLPLMGSCDWNDGMSNVGSLGKGESVWLSWFLQDCIGKYIQLSRLYDSKGAEERKKLKDVAQNILQATEHYAWDGDRYLRAFCDDGTVLGSVSSQECSIDSISQSWAAISGCSNPERAATALDTAVKHLADFNTGVIRLLSPSFHKMQSVGYIASYPQGVRENGGQYTHGAVWLAKALLMHGDSQNGYKILRAIHPISHTSSGIDVCRYRAEPYVICADVYSGAHGEVEHGRGGWSWYTGSASWFYRVVLEDLLGFRVYTKQGARWLSFKPNLPEGWASFRLAYRYEQTNYCFTVERGADYSMKLENDGKEHHIRISKFF